MRYGLPYLGSKNAIAEQIVDILPKANTLYDLFGGGGSITHCAALKHKYKHYVYNDIQQGLPQFFKDCIDGKYTVENCKDFIHREEFFARKDNDWYVKLIWSFGNDGTTYMYGKDIEDYKKAYHNAVVFNDYEALEQIIGAKIISSEYKTTEERRSDIGLQLVKIWQQNKFLDTSPEAINRLQHFSRINNLKELQNIKSSNMDFYNTGYDNIPIEKDSVIYCDIPYRNTDCGLYKSDFDYERFYQWALSQDTIFISEYSMPNDFIEVANIDKIVLSTTADVRLRSIEKIFTTPKTLEHFEMPLRYEQISLFDWE